MPRARRRAGAWPTPAAATTRSIATTQWHEDPASDLGRTKRQQQFVNLALHTALDRIKVDPFAAGRLIKAIGSSLRVDDELDPVAAATSLRSAVDAGIATYSLPVYGKTIGGNAVLLLADGSDAVLSYFRGDGPPPPAPTPEPSRRGCV